MNRSQKSSLAASALLHGGLVAAVLFVSAFQPASRPPVELPPIDFVPVITTDLHMSGGGSPHGQSLPAPLPPVVRPAPAPQPTPPLPRARPPQPVRQPDPLPPPAPVPPTRPVRADDSLTPAPKKSKKPEIDLTAIVTRSRADEKKKRAEIEAREAERIARVEQEAREREEARAQAEARAAANAFKRSVIGGLQHLASRVSDSASSSGIAIELKGPGGGGLPYANFLQGVQRVYEMDWRPRIRQRVVSREGTAKASVTIARDGTVVAHRLVESSGSREIDDSVRASLDAVKHTVPLPPGAEENERTITIGFNVTPEPGVG